MSAYGDSFPGSNDGGGGGGGSPVTPPLPDFAVCRGWRVVVCQDVRRVHRLRWVDRQLRRRRDQRRRVGRSQWQRAWGIYVLGAPLTVTLELCPLTARDASNNPLATATHSFQDCGSVRWCDRNGRSLGCKLV